MDELRALKGCSPLPIFILLLAVGLGITVATHRKAMARPAAGAPSGGAAGAGKPFDLANLDPGVKPCTDFFHYADGGWIKAHPIPPAYSSWGTFNELAVNNRTILRGILEKDQADKSAAPGSNNQKLGDYYSSCMDRTAVNAAGAKPLQPEFDRINHLSSLADLRAEVARLPAMGVNAMFEFGSAQDLKNSSQVIGDAAQGGLGLPDRDYYTKTDAKSVEIRKQYVAHVSKMLQLLGDNAAKSDAEAAKIMQIETKLAEASLTRVQRRAPNALYHKMDLAQLRTLAPDLDWETYFHQIGQPGMGSINVDEPGFFKTLNQQLQTVSVADWKTYLRWHLINSTAPALSTPFVDEDFNFHGRILTGAKEKLPRWQRCVASTDRSLGEALGQQYVKKAFPPQAKAKALAMVNNLIAALHSDLTTLSWMSPETRQQAIAKLQVVMKKIGYPDKWRDYSALKITPGPYVDNYLAARHFAFNYDLNKIGKPVDRTEWEMTPPTVNAYYDPSMNEIVFPAGILQPPFFNPKADDAINYGAMGVVIGHEMTHGFDDEGRQFDAKGNLVNWGTPDALQRFKARAECVARQFDSFVVDGDVHENGHLVLGESIADLGGLAIAYAAYQKSLEGKPAPAPIDGFTADQRFFLGYAQVWAGSDRPQLARLRATVDPHPASRYRVNGPLSNMPAFAKAFGCKAGDPMVRPPDEQCHIW